MDVLYNALYKNFTNGSAPSKMAARPESKTFFKQHLLLNHWSKYKMIYRRVRIMPFTKIAQMVPPCLIRQEIYLKDIS